jgi:hypothetical protein
LAARSDSARLRIGQHKLDIRFWSEGVETAFEVIKGDPNVVERCDIASKAEQLRGTPGSAQRADAPAS